MKVTETRDHGKNDNYLKKKQKDEKKEEVWDKEGRKAFCSIKSFTGLTKCKRKSLSLFSLSLRTEAFRVICCHVSCSCSIPSGLNNVY